MEIDGFEIEGRTKCNRQQKGGVLLRFSRVKIRLSWHQQEFTREIFLFLFEVNPVILGIFVSGLFEKKVCCSQESDYGTFLYHSARGVEGGIWS